MVVLPIFDRRPRPAARAGGVGEGDRGGVAAGEDHRRGGGQHREYAIGKPVLVLGRIARNLPQATDKFSDANATLGRPSPDRKSVVQGKSESVRVDIGGRRIIKKKKK